MIDKYGYSDTEEVLKITKNKPSVIDKLIYSSNGSKN